MGSDLRGSIPASSTILALLVRRVSSSFDVLALSRSRLLPGGVRVVGPTLSGPNGDALPDDATEIVAEVLDAQGTLLDAFAWGASPRDFTDTVGPDGEIWKGSSDRDEDRPRRMYVPIRRAGRYLVFSKSYFVRALDTRAERRDTLAAFRLRPRSTGEAGAVVPPPLRPLLKGGGLRDLAFRAGVDSFATGVPTPNGRIQEVTSLRRFGRGDRRFDIVVTGDGFAECDIETFNRDAEAVIEGLRSLSPFRELDDLMNYHTVVAVSDESGITDPTRPDGTRRTYYHSTTCFRCPDAPHAIATEYPQLVHQAAALVKPWSEIELVIVIANAGIYGGYAMRRHGVAFISRHSHNPLETLVRLAAHEGGHVIAKLADEYISCDPYDPLDDRPNVATAKQLEEGTVRWRDLARPDELTSDGDFRVVHRYGQPMNNQTGEPELPDDQLNSLGAFWGCMYTTPPADDAGAACEVFSDERGKDFYRPMAHCLMRRRAHAVYCRACERAVAEAIRENTLAAPARRRTPGGEPPARFPLAAQKK